MSTAEFLVLIILLAVSYQLLKRKISSSNRRIINKRKTLPSYYATSLLIWNLLAVLCLMVLNNYVLDISVANQKFIYFFAIVIVSILSLVFINAKFKAREHLEKLNFLFMVLCTLSTVLITIFIITTVFVETSRFFDAIPVINFMLGANWNPQNEIHIFDKVSFGAIPVFLGTFLITTIAISTSAPIGILSAIYLTEYSSKKFRRRIKPLLEVLAGIPTVVYGYFAANVVAPFIRDLGSYFALEISSESALACGIVMGIMITPYILSLVDDVISSVPQTLRDASLAIGATKSETIKRIVIPAALPGIYGALLLAISRAIGETMIVTMAAGLNANFSLNPFESVTTVTAQIVALLTGDQEFNSSKTLAAFALAFVLFTMTFILNIFAQILVGRNKIKYE